MSLIKEACKQLFRKQCTLKYPYEKSTVHPGFRGRPSWDLSKCIGCSLCQSICPAVAIKMVGKGQTAEIKHFMDCCIRCGECVDVCSKKAIVMTEEFETAGFDRSAMLFYYKRETAKQKPVDEPRVL